MKYFLIFVLLIFIGCKSIPEKDLWIVGKWQIIDSEIYPVKIGSFELKENSKLDFNLLLEIYISQTKRMKHLEMMINLILIRLRINNYCQIWFYLIMLGSLIYMKQR